MEFDLNYSEDALLTRVLFLASQKGLNVFVEDTNKEYEYEEIFERLLPEGLSLNCIFPTGGKMNLEEAYELFGTSSEWGKTFFIADGDFDVALEKAMIEADNFVYLKRYNIESYLLHKDTIIRFMRPKIRKTLKQTNCVINYDNWWEIVSPFFIKLFCLHFTVQKYCYGIANVKRGYARFLESNGLPKEYEYQKYKEEVSLILPDIEDKLAESKLILENVYGSEAECFVCGKCYIGSLKLYLNKHCKNYLEKGISDSDLKAILISGFDISLLDYVKDKLLTYMIA